MNKKHKVWSLVNFDEDLEYISRVVFVTASETVTLPDYIERIYDNMKFKVDNGHGCAVDSNLNDMSFIIAMVNTNDGTIVHNPFIGCKFILNMNEEEVSIVRFADENINEIMSYVAGSFRENFCKKADIIEDSMLKHISITKQYKYINWLMARLYDDRIINYNKILDSIENIKMFIVKEYFEDDTIDIHKLTTRQLSIIIKIPIKDIRDAAKDGRIVGFKEGRKWYFDFDVVFEEIFGGATNNETE